MVTHIYPLIVDLPILTHIYMVIFHSYLCLPKANHQPAVTFQSHGQGQAPEEIGHGFRLGAQSPVRLMHMMEKVRDTSIAGWFFDQVKSHQWMMTGGTPIEIPVWNYICV